MKSGKILKCLHTSGLLALSSHPFLSLFFPHIYRLQFTSCIWSDDSLPMMLLSAWPVADDKCANLVSAPAFRPLQETAKSEYFSQAANSSSWCTYPFPSVLLEYHMSESTCMQPPICFEWFISPLSMLTLKPPNYISWLLQLTTNPFPLCSPSHSPQYTPRIIPWCSTFSGSRNWQTLKCECVQTSPAPLGVPLPQWLSRSCQRRLWRWQWNSWCRRRWHQPPQRVLARF